MSSLIEFTYNILRLTKFALVAEEKYFLIRLMAVHGCDAILTGNFFRYSVLEFEDFLGVSDNQIKKARDSLISKSYLVKMTKPDLLQSQGGRPKVFLALSDQAIRMFRECSGQLIPQDKINRINNLLLWHPKSALQNKSPSKRLSIANWILLAVLYIHADECGVVQNLGIMQLSKLAGLVTRDRVEGQLEKLSRLGYLLDHASGLSGKVIWRSEATGLFFLNIIDEDLIIGEKNIVLLLATTNRVIEYTYFCPANRIMSFIRNLQLEANKQEAFEYENLHLFVDDFNKKPSWVNLLRGECNWIFNKDNLEALRFVLRDLNKIYYSASFIQYKIALYASLMLSEHWISVQREFVFIDDILKKLKSDILPDKFREKFLKTDINAGKYITQFDKILYRLIFETALLTKNLIRELLKNIINDDMLSNARYTILSKPNLANGKMTHHAVIVKLYQGSDYPKAVTLNVECRDKYTKNFKPTSFNLQVHNDFSFISKSPWSSFKLNLRTGLI